MQSVKCRVWGRRGTWCCTKARESDMLSSSGILKSSVPAVFAHTWIRSNDDNGHVIHPPWA
jgi:hypothetical protein